MTRQLPVKERIVARLLELLEGLRAQGVVRKVSRELTVLAAESVRPAIHLVVGDENVVGRDNQGYTCEFAVAFNILIADARSNYRVAEQIAAEVQRAVESDPQLLGADPQPLCVSVEYRGQTPFSDELTRPEGGTILQYQIRYRRSYGAPDVSY
ncbi:MAG: hypothetical protein N2379_10910 [Verrucomicrobiae bacterium]|nr:hypothetical protein [Verrucomicrobiae bacterium]